MADTWITPTRKKDLLSYVDQLKKLSGGPVEEEDLYAAGFSENDLEDIGWFAPQEKAPMMAGDGSKLEAYTPTSRDNVRTNVMGGLQKFGLDKQLARSVAVKVAGEENPADGGLGMGLADFTPMGALFGAEEGVNAVKRGVNSGDYTSAGLGALNAATSVASALPGGKVVSQGVNKLAEKLAGQYDPSVVRTFFGPTSVKADVGKLRKAEQLAASGADEQTVWQETGWWNGPNGWRFEVDDSQMVLPNGALESTIQGKNKNVIKHDDFWEAMSPREELSDADWVDQENAKFMVQQGNTTLGPMDAGKEYKGVFKPDSREIEAYGYAEGDQKNTIVHEMQHAIQNVLGDGGKGANPEWVGEQFNKTVQELPEELRPAVVHATELGYSKVRLAEMDRSIAAFEEKAVKEVALNEDALSGLEPSYTSSDKEFIRVLKQDRQNLVEEVSDRERFLQKYNERFPDFQQALGEFELLGRGTGTQWFSSTQSYREDLLSQENILSEGKNGVQLNEFAKHSLYELESGEVEARVAGDRAEWSAADRARYAPATDVANKDYVYKTDDLLNWFSGVKSDADKVRSKQGYAKGGVVQEKDPVSGNEVPPGAEPEEVRDDIDAKLSDGEYVIPADVVRYIGLDKIEKLILQAKEGLAEMDKQGRIGGEDVPEEDDLPFTDDELAEVLPDNEASEGEPPAMHMAVGGLVSAGDRIRNGVMSPISGPATSTGLPPWMQDPMASATASPAGPEQRTALTGQSNPSGSWADRQAEKTPMGMAGPVESWKAKDFSSAVKQRSGDPGVRVIEGIVSKIPFGGLAMNARNKYLDKKVPGAIDEMIASGKDVDGTPLSQQQVADLQKAKADFASTAGYKAGGLKALVKETVKSIIPKKDEVAKDKESSSKDSSKKSDSAADKKEATKSSSSSSSSSKKDDKKK